MYYTTRCFGRDGGVESEVGWRVGLIFFLINDGVFRGGVVSNPKRSTLRTRLSAARPRPPRANPTPRHRRALRGKGGEGGRGYI